MKTYLYVFKKYKSILTGKDKDESLSHLKKYQAWQLGILESGSMSQA